MNRPRDTRELPLMIAGGATLVFAVASLIGLLTGHLALWGRGLMGMGLAFLVLVATLPLTPEPDHVEPIDLPHTEFWTMIWGSIFGFGVLAAVLGAMNGIWWPLVSVLVLGGLVKIGYVVKEGFDDYFSLVMRPVGRARPADAYRAESEVAFPIAQEADRAESPRHNPRTRPRDDDARPST